MRQIKPETAIKRRVKALQEALKAADEEKQTVVTPLIGQVARLEYQLQKLMEQLEVVGFVEEYKNGENQFGTKGINGFKGLLHHVQELCERHSYPGAMSSGYSCP